MCKTPVASDLSVVESQPARILVVGSLNPPGVGDDLKGLLLEFSNVAFASVRRSNGQLHFIEASTPDRTPELALDGMDGLLILGGADADPMCYGQPRQAQTMYGINPVADRFELELLRHAEARNLPVLGICRGMQLMNVLHGGDLVQEIGSGTIHYDAANHTPMVFHPVELEPDSHLHDIYKGRRLSVRSGHHQAVGRLGERLAVTARAEDGIIEAVEVVERHWMVGVQWHPEDPAASAADLDLLMAGFINAARQRKHDLIHSANLSAAMANDTDA
ncbi:MAG TPA: gamma-glutamyl-gamma-aminobutyrate hydrolase family protein [Hyphomicrobium sp.]|jgi:putative glutamine amidotransferase|nr:gamma-glutamyl-gamma-aminobutyrate hydrolase family protein [Hyphomicrobium sp.]